MKATSGNLRLDQTYKLVDSYYLGGLESIDFTQCENCGLAIANVATVLGSVDNVKYHIGIDCASTLTSINACEIAEAKKKLAKQARFVKSVKTECTFAIIGANFVWFYKKPVTKWESYWKARTWVEDGERLIKALNMPFMMDKDVVKCAS